MRKVIIIIIVVILAALGAYGGFEIRGQAMAKNIMKEYNQIMAVDLDRLADGNYRGRFDDFLQAVDLDVKVKDHRIVGVTVNSQRCGKGYEAREVVDRIIKEQSVSVDVVSGASASSRCIMIAAYKALTEQ